MNFSLGCAVNPDRVFIQRKSNVVGRFDPFHFRPELVALEKRVQAVAQSHLRDFVQFMAGGATPSTKQADTHYTRGDDGVPFIRVQNLSTTGRLDLEDCKHITRSTHEGLLRRSRLSGGELLVKITGVGRMAVASVVPKDFEGNINQHIVAIRTDGIKTSEMLAAYLNLDLVERLASRRSTGGTRPALDYPALLSIPVVRDERLPGLMRAAVDRFQNQVDEAKALLSSIDGVLLDELSIPRTATSLNTLESRIFSRNYSDVSGSRIDPASNWKRLSLESSKQPMKALRNVAQINPVTRPPQIDAETPVSFVPMDAVSDVYGEIEDLQMRPLSESGSYTPFRDNDVIWAKITPCMENGKSAVARDLQEGFGYGSTEFHVFRPRASEIRAEFLHYLLRLGLVREHARLNFTGSSGHQRVDQNFFQHLEIPVPVLSEQARIVEKLDALKSDAKKLFVRAKAGLAQSKHDIESLILGNEVTT